MATYVPISDYVWFQEGPGVRNTQYTSKGVKLINVANLVDGNIDLSTSSRYISEEEAYGRYKHFLVDDGDFIIASSGIQVDYFDKKMGFIRKDQLPLCMNTSTIRFKNLKPDLLNMRYFMYCLKSDSFKQQLGKHIVGSAQLNFGPSHLKKMVFPIVNVQKQILITSLLDKIYSLISFRQKQIQKLDDLIKARFVEMTQSSVTTSVRMGDVATYVNGFAFKPSDWTTEGLPIIRIQNLNDKEALYNHFAGMIDSKYRVHTGDILVSWATHLEAYVWQGGDAWLNQHIFRVIFDKMPINQIYYVYSTEEALRQAFRNAHGFKPTMEHIKRSDFENAIIELPPIEIQEEFAAFVSEVDKSKLSIQQGLEKLETLKKSLMQQYFG